MAEIRRYKDGRIEIIADYLPGSWFKRKSVIREASKAEQKRSQLNQIKRAARRKR